MPKTAHKREVISKNLFDLEHQYYMNFMNIVLIVEATLLIALWVGKLDWSVEAKNNLTIISLLVSALVVLYLLDRIQKVRENIERL